MKEPNIELIPLRTAVARDRQTTLDLLVRITAPQPEKLPERPALNLALVIDRSGSMGGEKLEFARKAACYAVDQLLPGDRVAVTIFDNDVSTIVPAQLAKDRESIKRAIRQVHAGGSTALHSGWVEGAMQVSQVLDPTRLNRVILLSDGLANVGETNPDRIGSDVKGLSQRGISTTTMGIGDDYDESLLEAMARSGDGNFYHIQSPDQLPVFFAAELRGLLATCGSKVSLGIEPGPDVVISDILNDLDKTEYGRLKLSNLVMGSSVPIAVRLCIPPQAQERDLCSFRLAWDSPEDRKRHKVHAVLRLPVIGSTELDLLPADSGVEQQFALLLAARAKQEAIRAIDRNDMAAASGFVIEACRMVSAMPASPEMLDERLALEDLQHDLQSHKAGTARKKATFQNFSRRRGRNT
ncbi:MAG: VWA domain-containing protein [Acidobacteria bacterium]|nr:MAG: VWA domain-containing protein [Acidobacteriota bacterium]